MIPIFPLQLVLFPSENLNLHIFEPRYKELINDCNEKSQLFGIPTHEAGKNLTYGTTAKLLKIVKLYDDGKMDVKTKGIQVFKIKSFDAKMDGKLYGAADVEFVHTDRSPNIIMTRKIISLMKELYTYMKIKKTIPQEDEELFSYKVGHHVGMSMNQELKLLSIPQEVEREEFIYDHLVNLLPVVKEMETLRKKVEMNGHFKNILPPDF